MKRTNNLYPNILLVPNIISIYTRQIRLHTRNKRKIERFEDMFVQNIVKIKAQLENYSYKVGKYNIFLIKEPKVRIIMSQEISDKIVNHLITKYFLLPVLEPCLLDCNVASREGKGTAYGFQLIKKYINEIKQVNPNFYILKFDISKYFYEIDHEITKTLLKNKIKDSEALNILYETIDSTNNTYVNERITTMKENYKNVVLQKGMSNVQAKIEEIDKVPLYENGKGLPIGNYSSQILALYYLNELDHMIKEQLGIKYYVRYMDDGILLHESKEYLIYCLQEIQKMVEKYKLRLNKKTNIQPMKNGLDFLGFHFFIKNNKLITHISNKTKRRFQRKMRKLYKMKKNEKIKDEDIQQVLGSYLGHLSYGNTHSLVKTTLSSVEGFGEDYILDI